MEAVRLLFVSIPGVDRANPFGFSWLRGCFPPKDPSARVALSWVCLDSLVRIGTFQRVAPRYSGKLFFPRLSSRARRRSGSPALAREMSGLVMARRLSRILIFCNDLSIRQDSSTQRSLRFAKARLQSLSLGRTAEPMQPERPPIAYDRPSDPGQNQEAHHRRRLARGPQTRAIVTGASATRSCARCDRGRQDRFYR
jgi:hypothetical protein